MLLFDLITAGLGAVTCVGKPGFQKSSLQKAQIMCQQAWLTESTSESQAGRALQRPSMAKDGTEIFTFVLALAMAKESLEC